jgi:hypothetical protein
MLNSSKKENLASKAKCLAVMTYHAPRATSETLAAGFACRGWLGIGCLENFLSGGLMGMLFPRLQSFSTFGRGRKLTYGPRHSRRS